MPERGHWRAWVSLLEAFSDISRHGNAEGIGQEEDEGKFAGAVSEVGELVGEIVFDEEPVEVGGRMAEQSGEAKGPGEAEQGFAGLVGGGIGVAGLVGGGCLARTVVGGSWLTGAEWNQGRQEDQLQESKPGQEPKGEDEVLLGRDEQQSAQVDESIDRGEADEHFGESVDQEEVDQAHGQRVKPYECRVGDQFRHVYLIGEEKPPDKVDEGAAAQGKPGCQFEQGEG